MTDVRATRQGALGRLTLDRPAALNALTLDTVRALDAALTDWADDPDIGCVLIEGAGTRAFCAGGDIRALHAAYAAGDLDGPARFFAEEYRLNARLARYGKPLVSLMHGVTMGGGIGLGGHVAHRIVTGTSRLAMPEVGIGFFPDVGGTHLLGTAPGELGTHAALTGSTLEAADASLCGLADRFVAAEELGAVPERLAACRSPEDVRRALGDLSCDPGAGFLAANRSWIDRCYRGDDVAAILDALEAAPEPEARQAAERIRGHCPFSLVVTLRALRGARGSRDLDSCLAQELRVSLRITRRADFREGVRAAVIDKDKRPRWHPGTLADVDPAEVEAQFAPLDAADGARVGPAWEGREP